MCFNEEEIKLGHYADIFKLSTDSIAADIDDPCTIAAIEKLQEEIFKALRLLENEIIILSNK